MKKNMAVKFFAFLALFGIIISVVGTGIMIFMGGNEMVQEEQEFTQEDLQKLIDSGDLKLSDSGSITGTGEIKK